MTNLGLMQIRAINRLREAVTNPYISTPALRKLTFALHDLTDPELDDPETPLDQYLADYGWHYASPGDDPAYGDIHRLQETAEKALYQRREQERYRLEQRTT